MENTSFCKMDQHFVFLSSSDSSELFPSNNPSDFTVQLAGTLDLKGTWYAGLKEVRITNKVQEEEEEEAPRELLICSDLCEDVFYGGTKLGILRRIHRSVKPPVLVKIFHESFYFKVAQSQLNKIRILIRGESNQPVNIRGRTSCTLHLKRVA